MSVVSVSVPEMVRPRQVGSDLPSGVRRPDRAVSLRDVRDLPVQTMGGLGEFDRLMGQMPEITETLDYYINQVLPGLSLDELEKEIEELSNAVEGGTSVGVGEMEDGDRLDAAIEERGERAAAGEGGLGWQGERQEASEEGRKVFGAESRGLTADEAFRQHHAMAGGEPPREGRAHPERVPAPYEPVPPMSKKQKKLNRENIEKIRRGNPISQMAGPDWDAIEQGDYGAGNWWDTVPGMDDLGDALPDDDEPLNPELRSMDSQMLADMMVAQPEQGYFGGLGDAVQGQLGAFQNASTEEKLAIVLTGLAALSASTGVGGPLVPPLLGGSALLNAVG